MINEHKFTKSEAIESLKKMVKKFNLTKIRRIDSDDLFEKMAIEANQRVVTRENNPKLKIGEQDITIVGGFLREKVNFIHSGDNGFLKTCEELGLNTVPLPKRDADKEKEIKRYMKKGRS